MDWVLASLVSAAVFAVVSVMDKRILAVHVDGMPGFYFLVGLMQFVMAIVAVLVEPWQGASLNTMTMAALSGTITGAGLLCLFYGIRALDISRAIPIFHTFPVFVAILAVAFLGETLVAGQWGAVLVVVAGAFTISIWGSRGGRTFRLNRAFPILIGASLFTALGLLTGKYALEELPVWFVYSTRNYGMAVMFAFLWRPGAFGQLFGALRSWRTALLLFLAEFSLAPLAVFLNVTAINLGPVSLVSTITATRPLFVFLYGTLLSTSIFPLLNEPLDRRTLAVKLVAIMMIVGGIAALTLL
jgi:drug/metabolite transporter (DMT)-like permease